MYTMIGVYLSHLRVRGAQTLYTRLNISLTVSLVEVVCVCVRLCRCVRAHVCLSEYVNVCMCVRIRECT